MNFLFFKKKLYFIIFHVKYFNTYNVYIVYNVFVAGIIGTSRKG